MLAAFRAGVAGVRSSIRSYAHSTFSSLKVRNYRLYFIGQGVSLCGTFMQALAQSWLVLTLTGSLAAVGIVSALQFGPVLVLGPYGGIMADRFSKRKLLIGTQSAQGALALLLGVLVVTHAVTLWMVYAVAGALGVINALDNPTRQTFMHEMVGRDLVGNAVTLSSTELNLSRIIGPMLAGVLIATLGIGMCFMINAASFAAVLACLAMMRDGELQKTAPAPRAKGQLREGLRYVRRTPVLRDALIMIGVVGTLTYEFQVTLVGIASLTFHANADTYALLISAMSVGAIVGGLVIANRRGASMKALSLAGVGFGAATIAVACSPTLLLAALGMAIVGVFSICFTTLSNTILQLNAAPRMRGRVMSLWSAAFLGSSVIGAPAVGWIGDRLSPEWGLAVGGIAALGAGAYGLMAMKRHPEIRLAEQPVPLPSAPAEDAEPRYA
jgi:MFS family permease